MLAVYDQVDRKMTCYKSFKEDSEFVQEDIAVYEKFSDADVSVSSVKDVVFLCV